MSSLFEQYCDVTESMAFKSSQLHVSSTLSTSIPKPINHNRLKCFNCFGMADKQQQCNHCGGTNFVTDNHPLALLFNEVFQRKLGKTAPLKDPVWVDFQDVDTITEQQEQLDERKIICDVCNKECDINYKYFCQCCECFFVCQKCAEQKGNQINHPHPLATNKKLSNGLPLFKRTSSNNYGSHRKSEQNSSVGNNLNRNKIDEQEKCNIQFFNVCDIIEKQISHTYGNVAQNISCDPSESISGPEFGMMQSLAPYHFKLLQLQGSDKGVKPIRQNAQDDGNLTKSVNPPSNSFFISDISIKQRQSIDFNIVGKDSIRKSFNGRQSFGFDYENYTQEHCNNCGNQLKDVYTICRTCQKNNENFKICCQCDDKKLYTHEKDHFMEMMLGNLLGRNSQMVSKKLIDSQDQQQKQEPKLNKRKSSLQQRPPRLDQTPFDQTLSGKKSFSKLKSSGSLGMSVQLNRQPKPKIFGEQSIVNLDCQGLFNSTDLTQQLDTIRLIQKKSSLCQVNNSMQNIPHPSRFNHAKNKPKVAFAEIGSDQENVKIAFVESDSDQQESHHFQSHKFQQVTIKSSRSSYKGFKSVKSMVFSKNQDYSMIQQSHQVHETIKYSQQSIKYTQKSFQRNYQSQLVEQNFHVKEKVEYIFHQYHCDECGCDPIKNVRYHCLQCEDFDVCQNCYGFAFKCKHNHRFQKIDGLKKLQDKKNMMLQKKDLNKGKDSLLRSSNIGMLAKSKKTVDLLKRNVQQLGNTISNLDRSYSSYNDFFSQKFSFKTKVQYC